MILVVRLDIGDEKEEGIRLVAVDIANGGVHFVFVTLGRKRWLIVDEILDKVGARHRTNDRSGEK